MDGWWVGRWVGRGVKDGWNTEKRMSSPHPKVGKHPRGVFNFAEP